MRTRNIESRQRGLNIGVVPTVEHSKGYGPLKIELLNFDAAIIANRGDYFNVK